MIVCATGRGLSLLIKEFTWAVVDLLETIYSGLTGRMLLSVVIEKWLMVQSKDTIGLCGSNLNLCECFVMICYNLNLEQNVLGQQTMDHFYEGCCNWKLSLNASKCNVLKISRLHSDNTEIPIPESKESYESDSESSINDSIHSSETSISSYDELFEDSDFIDNKNNNNKNNKKIRSYKP